MWKTISLTKKKEGNLLSSAKEHDEKEHRKNTENMFEWRTLNLLFGMSYLIVAVKDDV